MRAALATGDFETIRVIGHNCKGIGKGFPEIGTLGAALEIAAQAADASAIEASLADFERFVMAACAEVEPVMAG
jgi:hypothetical protein